MRLQPSNRSRSRVFISYKTGARRPVNLEWRGSGTTCGDPEPIWIGPSTYGAHTGVEAEVVAPLRRWSKPGFVLSGSGLALACAATLALEFVGPVPVIWALPVLGVAVGLIAGAGAFWSLHPDLEQHTPRLAVSSAGFAVATLVAALVAIVGGVGAVARGELPAGIAVGASVLTLSGFVVTALLVAVAAWRSAVLPRWVAVGLVAATALLLGAPVSAMVVGAVPMWLLVLLLGAWGLVLVVLSRAIPHQA